MIERRTGTYGEYFGSLWGSSEPLNSEQMAVNALYVYSALTDKGWTPESIAGVLGNMEHESSINPGRWQSENVGNNGGGYGLVQWTPSTKYTNWCAETNRSDPSEMDNEIDRILYELETKIEYYPTEGYPLTFQEFTKSTGSPYDLACAFAWNYERSYTVLYGTEEEKAALRIQRGSSAESWYSYITGREPTPPGTGGGGVSTTTTKRKSYNFVLFGRKAWRN